MKKIKPKWVVFDVGGVLLDWVKSSDYLASKLDVSQELLLETMFSYALKMNIGLLDAREGWEKILKDLDREVMEPIEAIRHWRDKRFWIQDSLELASELHKADTFIKDKSKVIALLQGIANIRGEHTTGEGREPTADEAEFIVSTAIYLYTLLESIAPTNNEKPKSDS